jgi:hypothetical protein
LKLCFALQFIASVRFCFLGFHSIVHPFWNTNISIERDIDFPIGFLPFASLLRLQIGHSYYFFPAFIILKMAIDHLHGVGRLAVFG